MNYLTFDNNITINSPFFNYFVRLYNTFPRDERRELHALEAKIVAEERFRVDLCMSTDGEFMGFVSWWNFGTFVYIEHLAVEPTERGKGIGHAILQHVLDEAGLPVVLEIEPTVTPEAVRRLAFYRSAGMVDHPEVPYMQPPYDSTCQSIPMLLVTTKDFPDSLIPTAVETLATVVYEPME